MNLYLGTVDLLKAAHKFYERNGFLRITLNDLPSYFPAMPGENMYYYLSLTQMTDARYPIGKFEKPTILSDEVISQWIMTIADFPTNLSMEIASLTKEQLDTPYRAGGWTLRQVVHHCADSHINAFCRIKLALTEVNPVIKPYLEDRWANLADSKIAVDVSINMIKALHQRWVILLQVLDRNELQRVFTHPEDRRSVSIAEAIGMYAWHCKHHLAHITSLKMRKSDS